MEYNVVKKQKVIQFTSAHLMWISVAVFFAINVAYIIGLIKPNSLFNILFVVSACTPVITNVYGNYEFFPINYKVISQLILNSEMVILDGRSFDLKNIRRIEINVNDWYGKKIVTNVRPFGSGPKISRGINNQIEFEFENSESTQFDFQIDSFKHFQELSDWIKILYKTKIEIMEKYENSRTYGFDSLNYKEIQEFKKKHTT